MIIMVTFLKDACFPVTSKGWIASLDSFLNFRLLDPSGEPSRASTAAMSETGCADVNELSSFGVTSIESSACSCHCLLFILAGSVVSC